MKLTIATALFALAACITVVPVSAIAARDAGETTILTTRHDVDHPDFPGHALSDRSVADPDLAVALENRHHPDTPAETQLFRELGPRTEKVARSDHPFVLVCFTQAQQRRCADTLGLVCDDLGEMRQRGDLTANKGYDVDLCRHRCRCYNLDTGRLQPESGKVDYLSQHLWDMLHHGSFPAPIYNSYSG